MNLRELIQNLQAIEAEHGGDIEVVSLKRGMEAPPMLSMEEPPWGFNDSGKPVLCVY